MTVINSNAPKAAPTAPAPKADKLKDLETRAAQLCQLRLASPHNAPAAAAPQMPDVQAITTLAKTVTVEDFLNRSDDQLLHLLTALGGALEELIASPKSKTTDAAVEAIRNVGAQAVKEREDILLAKAEMLKTLGAPSTKLAKVKELIKEAKIHFHDREFLFRFVQVLIRRGPTFLCTILNEFPLTNTDDILQLGALLKEETNRAKFAAHFKIPKAKIEEARAQHLKSLSEMESRMNGFGGNCNGHSLTQISRNPPKDPKAFHRKAAFVQTAYRMQFRNAYHAPAFRQLGRAILDTPNSFPKLLAKAAKILGYAGIEDLLFDDMVKKSPLILAERIGRIAGSLHLSAGGLTETENRALLSVLDGINLTHCPVSEEVSPTIMNKLGLQPGKLIASAAPLMDLQENLMGLGDKSGKIIIDLSGKGGNHAITLCFDPPSFSDINDADLRTFAPKTQTFKSADEMIEALRKHILFTYGDEYEIFKLIRYLPAVKPASN